jgi:hypothetical protein
MVALFCFCLVGCGQSSKTPATPAAPTAPAAAPKAASAKDDFTDKLLGTWSEGEVMEDGSEVAVETTYMRGGKFNGAAQFTDKAGNSENLIVSGTWEIKDGYLNTKVEASNLPKMLPVGYSNVEKVDKVTDSEYVYVTNKGQTIVAKKVK